jgi:large subunit ribosomal protein L7/L12
MISKSNPVTSFDVILQSVDFNQKIPAIKAVRQLTAMGLKEAKDLVDHVPSVVISAVDEQTAVAARIVLETAGTVAVVPSSATAQSGR